MKTKVNIEYKTTATIEDTKHLDFNFELKQITDDDPDNFIFEGYASTFNNIDRGNDIVMPGAFTESLLKMTPKVLWQHKGSEPIGVVVEIFEDQKGLFVKCKLPKADSLVAGRIMPQMKIGSVNTMSIGYSVLDSEDFKEDGVWFRRLKRVTLWELSLVTIPMNPKAGVTDFKNLDFKDLPFPKKDDGSIDLKYNWNQEEAERRVKDFNKGKREGLPIVDIVNDELVVIPKAIFSLSAQIKSGKFKDLKEEETKKAIDNLDAYYVKMNLVSPVKEKSFVPYIETFEHIKDVSDFLKDFDFSNKETNALIHALKKIARNEQTYRKAQEDFSNTIDEFVNSTKKL